jgi:carbonic anhydrase
MCQKHSTDHASTPTLTRRGMLRLSALGGAAALGGNLLLPREADAAPWQEETIRTPDEALAALMAGNRRFVRGQVTTPQHNLRCVNQVPPKQTPFASVLGCADSRVPVELLFDRGWGEIFVCRSAGNFVVSELIGSLEYGAEVLKSKLVLVLGHADCGAVKATMERATVPGQISSLYAHIYPAVARSGGNLNRAIEENVRNQVSLLANASTVLAQLAHDGKVKIVGGVYDVCSGAVRLL